MNSWHDLRIWLSGFLGALALAVFVAATLIRAALYRARQGEEPALPRRPVVKRVGMQLEINLGEHLPSNLRNRPSIYNVCSHATVPVRVTGK